MTTVTHFRPPWAKPALKSDAPHTLWRQESSHMATVTHLRPPWAKPALKSDDPHTLCRLEGSNMTTVTHLRPPWAKPALRSDAPHTLWRLESAQMTTVTRFVGKIYQSRAALKLERPNRSSFSWVSLQEPKRPSPKCRQLHTFGHPGARRRPQEESGTSVYGRVIRF